MLPPTYQAPIFNAAGWHIGWRTVHEGPCDFTEGQCSCGRMDLGIVRADPEDA